VASVIDPLGGAPYVEWMTDEMERQAEAVFAHLDELGDGSILEGVYAGIENGYFVGEIAEAAYRFEREVNAGRRITVGVNAFTDGDEGQAELLRIDAETEDYQLKRLDTVKQRRDDDAVARALAAVTATAEDPTANVMPPILDAVRTYATLEEIGTAMQRVFGTYVEKAVI
jgi:methylmalonyl-CoA mutase N-terminal domain/subunit